MSAEIFYIEITEQIDSVTITEEVVFVEERNLPASELYTDSKATSLSVVTSVNKVDYESKALSLSTVASTNKATSDSKATSLSVIDSSNKAVCDSAASSLSSEITRKVWAAWVLS